jgi:uncharacterized integral membrane protein
MEDITNMKYVYSNLDKDCSENRKATSHKNSNSNMYTATIVLIMLLFYVFIIPKRT